MADTCPFCGSVNVTDERIMQVARTDKRRAICIDCGSRGPLRDGRVAAIEAFTKVAQLEPRPCR